MKNIFHHIKKHSTHVAKHLHKHRYWYGLGTFGAFAVVKSFFLIIGLLSGLTIFSQETKAYFSDPATTCSTVVAVPQSECEALLTLYNDTNGDNRVNKANRGTVSTICSNRHGIVCSDGHISQINIQYQNNLSGNIADFSGLPYLTQIDIQSNYITSVNLEGLSLLQTGFLSSNRTQSINLSGLASIKSLSLSTNGLSSGLDLAGLSHSIQTLGLMGNGLTTLPNNLNLLTGLTSISLGFNQLTTLPGWLTGFTSLIPLGGLNIIYNNINYGPFSSELTTFIDTKHSASPSWRTTQTVVFDGCDDTDIPQTECEALISFYNSTNGTGWNNKTNWLSHGIICGNRYGVACTSGHVTTLNMGQNNLSGNDINLSGLSYLNYIYIVNNTITSLNLEGLSYLQTGDFTNNRIQSINFSGLSSIGYLNLSYNQLTTISESLTGLSSLATGGLDISYNSIRYFGFSPSLTTFIDTKHISNVNWRTTQNLIFESCDSTDISQTECEALISFYNSTNGSGWNNKTKRFGSGIICGNRYGVTCTSGHVTQLGFTNNNLSGGTLILTGLSYLQTGNFGQNNVSTVLLSGLSDLRSLDISYNPITTLNISGSTNISELNLNSTQLSQIPNTLSSLSGLETLRLESNNLSSIPSWFVGSFPNLTHLYLYNNKITSLPNDFIALTGLTNLVIRKNCLVPYSLSLGLSTFLSGYSTDSPVWSSDQLGCSPDFSLSYSFGSTPPYVGITNVINFSLNQGYTIPSYNNYIEIDVGNDFVVNLSENTGRSSSISGVYRYNLDDLDGPISTIIPLTGILSSQIVSTFWSFSGGIFTDVYDRSPENNSINSQSYYISASVDFGLTGSSVSGGVQSGDILDVYISYENNEDLATDGIIIGTFSSGVSLLSSGNDYFYPEGDLFISGDWCFDRMFLEKGPYYYSILNIIRSWDASITSIDQWLVENFGYESDPEHEIENLEYVCANDYGYTSFKRCLMNDFGVSLTKDNYPQCGGPKVLFVEGDSCYDEFLEETGVYMQAFENRILDNGYVSADEWLTERGYESNPNLAGENIINLCTAPDQRGYSTMDDCLIENFSIQLLSYADVCGKQSSSLPAWIVDTPGLSGGTFSLQIQTHQDITEDTQDLFSFEIFSSLKDHYDNNNTFVYPTVVVPEEDEEEEDEFTPPTGGGGGGILVQDQCPDTRDCSDSYYDNLCGPCSLIETIVDILPFHNAADLPTGDIENSTYGDELNTAYLRAYQYGITTMPSIQKANIEGTLIRKDMAKMITNFAINVLDRNISTGATCLFDDMDDLPKETQYYAMAACRLGLMGYESDGVTLKKSFDPEMEVDRSQFGTILSRLLRGNKYNGGTPYYVNHLNALKTEGIMTKIEKPSAKEMRGWVMVMMQRIFETR